MTALLHEADGRSVPLRLPAPDAIVLLADVPLACGCKVPVHVIGVKGTLRQKDRATKSATAACWECSRELGTLEIESPILLMGEIDEGFPDGFRGRVYGMSNGDEP